MINKTAMIVYFVVCVCSDVLVRLVVGNCLEAGVMGRIAVIGPMQY